MAVELPTAMLSNPCQDDVINCMPDAVLIVDIDDIVTRANNAAYALLGYTSSELIGRPLARLLTAGSSEHLSTRAAASARGVVADLDTSLHAKDGRAVPVRVSGGALCGTDGKLCGMVLVAHSTARRRQAERQRIAEHAVTRLLAESNTRADVMREVLQTICESLDWSYGAYWSLDKQDQILSCDQTWAVSSLDAAEFRVASENDAVNLRGSKLREIGGLIRRAWNAGNIVWMSDIAQDATFRRGPAALRIGLRSALAFPILVQSEIIGVLEFYSGKVRHPEESLNQTFRTIGYQVGQFIKRKQAEARQAMEHEVTRLLAEADTAVAVMPRIIETICAALGWDYGAHWYVDKRADLMRCDATWCAPSVNIEKFVVASRTSTNPRPPRQDEQVPESGGVVRRACARRRPIWVADVTEDETFRRGRVAAEVGLHAAFAFPIQAGSEIIGALEFYSQDIRQPDGMLLDITQSIGHQIGQFYQRKTAEQVLVAKTMELEKSNRDLNQFAYVTSHDLKAPLRAIANLSQWLEEDLGDGLSEEIGRNMKLLRGRVHRMEALINGILQYSRIGRADAETATVDVGALLREIIDSLPVPARFSIVVDTGMPVLVTAPTQLAQVFSNLIGNAIKYHDRPDGRVQVSWRDTGEFHEFAVADDGPGIAPQYHEKIFMIFQTLASRDKVESTGIGLSLVKKIVEEHGGSVTLESDEGRGAIFRFTWPKEGGEHER